MHSLQVSVNRGVYMETDSRTDFTQQLMYKSSLVPHGGLDGGTNKMNAKQSREHRRGREKKPRQIHADTTRCCLCLYVSLQCHVHGSKFEKEIRQKPWPLLTAHTKLLHTSWSEGRRIPGRL